MVSTIIIVVAVPKSSGQKELDKEMVARCWQSSWWRRFTHSILSRVLRRACLSDFLAMLWWPFVVS